MKAGAWRFTAVVAVAAGVLPGCASAQREPAAAAAATFSLLARQDPAAACELLAESTREQLVRSEGEPCGEALTWLDLPPAGAEESVAVYELQAQVVRSDGTMFLTVEHGRWVVLAAGCRARPDDQPYVCELEKG